MNPVPHIRHKDYLESLQRSMSVGSWFNHGLCETQWVTNTEGLSSANLAISLSQMAQSTDPYLGAEENGWCIIALNYNYAH